MVHNTNPRTTAVFPPLPLLSGDEFVDGNGQRHDVTDVSITLTSAAGVQKVVTLAPRFGGWWAPTEG